MIIKANQSHGRKAAELALLLWPGHSVDEFILEMSEFISSDNTAIFLAFVEEEPVGFAQIQLRTDYVEGTSTSPVGYLEGLFVKEEYRKIGIARQLVEHGEQWAKLKGCSEFASDCELDNSESIAVHRKLGFTEANRIICFKKVLS